MAQQSVLEPSSPFEGIPARPMSPWSTGVHEALVPIASLPASGAEFRLQDALCPPLPTQAILPVVAAHMAAPAAP